MSGSAFVLQLPSNESEDCNLQLGNGSTYQVLSVLVPSDSAAWHERTKSWFAFFYILMSIYWFLFLSLVFAGVLLLIKRHLAQRFQVRTFIFIDMALIILGTSRVLFILIDPWGQQRFCNHLACVIISRLLGSLAFPSLTASYTLVFITLWISASINLGTSWIQRLRVLIPLCFIHYGVAITFEIIAALPLNQPLIVVVLLIACEAIFSFWGFLVCLMFMIAGCRLLKTVKKSAKSSSMICRDSPNINRHDLIDRSKFQNRGSEARRQSNVKLRRIVVGQQRRSIRKVTLITYITTFLGMIYSILSFFNLMIILLSLFYGCIGKLKYARQHPELWLTVRCIFFTLEISMAVLLTYAISDYTPLIDFLKKCFRCKSKDLSFSHAVEDTSASVSIEATTTTAPQTSMDPRTSPVHDGYAPNTPRGYSSRAKSPSPLSVSFSANN